jgi:hypothetical protein
MCVKKWFQAVEREMECVENEISRFIVGRGGAMAKKEPGFMEATYCES